MNKYNFFLGCCIVAGGVHTFVAGRFWGTSTPTGVGVLLVIFGALVILHSIFKGK